MRYLLSLLLLVLIGAPAAAQYSETNPLSLEIGDEIRVRSPGGDGRLVNGRVSALERNGLLFARKNDADPMMLMYAQIDTIDVKRHIRSQSTMLAGSWGAFLGAALGAVSAPLAAKSMDMGTGSAMAAFTAGGGVGGGLIGAGIGALLVPGRWYRHILR